MKILLVAVNAKFIHSSLALRSLWAYSGRAQVYVNLSEYTINQEESYILRDIYEQKPDFIGFSCYLWNIDIILRIIKNLKKVYPEAMIFAGGPEVSYNSSEVLMENPAIDFVIRGEGERTFRELAEGFAREGKFFDYSVVDGITYRNGIIIENAPAEPLVLGEIPFPYSNLEGLEHKILYYETQRGCPYHCQYCLSSMEKGVRFLPLERVYEDFNFFLSHRVRQVKLVDRTFNCNRKHATAIWKYLIDNDNGYTNFHMEITADLLDDEMLALLKTARKGLFQFEIGVQTTNNGTMNAIKRNVGFEKLSENVKKLHSFGNIHCHLDLIAGLPFENYRSFAKSFDDVYALEPEQLQLGFLKVLKGSGLHRDAWKYGIIYREEAPYEVLATAQLSYADILKIKLVEEVLELYYNSGKALNTLRYLTRRFPTPFAFYEALGSFWREKNWHAIKHGKMDLYQNLYLFCLSQRSLFVDIEWIREIIKLDIFMCENTKTLPPFLEQEETMEFKKLKRSIYENKEWMEEYLPEFAVMESGRLARMFPILEFRFDILKLPKYPAGPFEKKRTLALFRYEKGKETVVHVIPYEFD